MSILHDMLDFQFKKRYTRVVDSKRFLPGDVCGCGGEIELAIDVILDKEST